MEQKDSTRAQGRRYKHLPGTAIKALFSFLLLGMQKKYSDKFIKKVYIIVYPVAGCWSFQNSMSPPFSSFKPPVTTDSESSYRQAITSRWRLAGTVTAAPVGFNL
jgi:hypothetical protein